MTLDEEQIRAIQTGGIDYLGAPLKVDGLWGPRSAWWAGILTLPLPRHGILRRVLGYHQLKPRETHGANRGPFVDATIKPAGIGLAHPWCVALTSRVMREEGFKDWPYHVSAWALIQWAKQTGRVVKDPLPGDLFAFLYDENVVGFTPGHAGFVLGSDANWIADCDGNVQNTIMVGKRARQGLTFIRTVDAADFPLTMPPGLTNLDGARTR